VGVDANGDGDDDGPGAPGPARLRSEAHLFECGATMTTAEIWTALVDLLDGGRPGDEVAAWIERSRQPLADALGKEVADELAAIDFGRAAGLQQLRERVRALASARDPSLWIALRARRLAICFLDGTVDLADGIKEMHRIRLSNQGAEVVPAGFSGWAADLDEVPPTGARKQWDDGVVAERLAEAERLRPRVVAEAQQLVDRLAPLIARRLES
jgi:hypothetical protein